MGLFGGGGGGFVGGATNLVGGLTGAGGLPGGGGFGAGGGLPGSAGQAGGDFSNWWKGTMTKADVLDVMGNRADERDRQTEEKIAQQRQEMADFYGEKPSYKSLTNSSGNLEKKYKMGDAKDAVAGTVSIKDLDQRMNAAKDVGVEDVKYTGDINAGKDFGNAQADTKLLRNRAFGTDQSAWAKKLEERQRLGEQDQLGQLGHEQRTATAQSMNDMAMQGGLEGGARERLGRAGAREQMRARQGVFRQGQHDRLAIGIDDESKRMQLQQQMPGMSMALDQYNTGLQQQNRDVQNKLAFGNQATNLAEQQYNAGLNMQKANQWAGVSADNASRETNVSLANTAADNQFRLVDNQNLIGDVRGQNAYDLEAWTQKGQMMGNQNVADAQARLGSGNGGFFQNLGGWGRTT